MLKDVPALVMHVRVVTVRIVHVRIVPVPDVTAKRIFEFNSNSGIGRNNTLILIFLIAFGFSISGQVDTFRKGEVIDSIRVGTTSETYALYLPNSFDHNTLSAIVFIFDPGGRGKTGILPFESSAEKYNYILICSNNSKNGPFSTNFKIIDRLFESVFSTFNIDENRIYTAGFSGGSRLASAIAVLTGQIQGVIACGAGFSSESSHVPMSKEPFSYVGLVGERDMNYYEMFEVHDWLNRFQIDHEIFTFDGDHRWPTGKEIEKAFDWLELQAYKRYLKDRDHAITAQIFKSTLDRANSFYKEQHYLRSSWEYERIWRNFASIYSLDSIRKKLIKIKNTSAYSLELKQFKELKLEENKIKSVFSDRFNKELHGERIPTKFKWWEKKIADLEFEIDASNDISRTNMLKRIRYAIYAMVIENSYIFFNLKQFEKAHYCHHLAALLSPDRSLIFYFLSRDYAILDEKDKCIAYLKLAISKGLSNKKIIKDSEPFQKYLDLEEMKEILEEL